MIKSINALQEINFLQRLWLREDQVLRHHYYEISLRRIMNRSTWWAYRLVNFAIVQAALTHFEKHDQEVIVASPCSMKYDSTLFQIKWVVGDFGLAKDELREIVWRHVIIVHVLSVSPVLFEFGKCHERSLYFGFNMRYLLFYYVFERLYWNLAVLHIFHCVLLFLRHIRWFCRLWGRFLSLILYFSINKLAFIFILGVYISLIQALFSMIDRVQVVCCQFIHQLRALRLLLNLLILQWILHCISSPL